MVKVKICGITNPTDARLAARLGADALGFIFVKRTPRYVIKERARAIIASLPPFVTPVGVFADEEVKKIIEVCRFCGIHTVQLHGSETPRTLDRLSHLRRIKAFRIAKESDIAVLTRYNCEGYLLDTYQPGKLGGTGRTFNWQWATSAATMGPVILAGGLNPDNVAEAIRLARPYGVDVAGGVESEPGKKDRSLLEAFILRAKGVQT